MSTAGRVARHAGTGAGRAMRAWRKLPPDRRLAAWASFGLFLALFLPWYQETVIATGTGTKLLSQSVTLTGWGAFSFVEAAVLLVAAGVITLLFQRAEGRAFHLPGGDGWVIMAAGLWTCLLIVWRIFDKQGTSGHGLYATASGIEWGIFVALAVAALLAYAGARIRAAHQPEPPLPGDDGAAEPWEARRARPQPPAQRPTRVSKREQPTRVSSRDAPTPVSNRKPVDAPTRVSKPRTEQDPADRPTRPIGPAVVPEDPPTLEYQRKRARIVPEPPKQDA